MPRACTRTVGVPPARWFTTAPARKSSPARTNRGSAGRATSGRVTRSGDSPLPKRSPAVTATAITRNVVRLSGSLAATVALPDESVITDPRKNAVVRNCDRSTSAASAPPPPPGERRPFSPSGIWGATDTRLLARRMPSPRGR